MQFRHGCLPARLLHYVDCSVRAPCRLPPQTEFITSSIAYSIYPQHLPDGYKNVLTVHTENNLAFYCKWICFKLSSGKYSISTNPKSGRIVGCSYHYVPDVASETNEGEKLLLSNMDLLFSFFRIIAKLVDWEI